MSQSFFNIKTFRTFTSLKQFIMVNIKGCEGFNRLPIGIVPPYRGLMARCTTLTIMCVLAMGKAMPFLFAKVKSQPFNGSFV